jgi:hypothetical protein
VGPMINLISDAETSPAVAMKESPKLFFVSTPTDRALLSSEGSTVWCLKASEVGIQIDELIREGRVADAIGLVEAVGEAGLSPVSALACIRLTC